MGTKLDNRILLVNLIEKLDAPDMQQILAYAAGYEAGKIEQRSELTTKKQVKYQTSECSA